MARGKGEGSFTRVPKDKNLPLKYWQGSIEIPAIDGTRRRFTVRSKDKATALAKLDDAKLKLRERGDLHTRGETVEHWFNYWLNQIAVKRVRPKTFIGYESVARLHIIPTIGHVRLDKLTPTHVRRVHQRMEENGASSTYVLNAHRVMSVALKAAERENRIHRNPTDLVDAPLKAVARQEALTIDEAIRVLSYVADTPLGARWATALLTGARRGEVLGLEQDRVTDVLDLSWQLQRLRVTGGKPVVPANYEYRHLTGGLYLTRPKSRAGWRVIPLVDPLRSILERAAATVDNEWGLMFTVEQRTKQGVPTGRRMPIDPDQDSRAWKDTLRAAGIERNVVLHGLRHTAVDLLYEAGVPESVIVEIIGHSSRSMTRQYKTRGNRGQLIDAMERMSALLGRGDDVREIGP